MSGHAIENAKAWLEEITTWAQRHYSPDYAIANEADKEAFTLPLSVMVRDGWRNPGAPHNDEGPEEYEILLTTGGPALRIWGQLSYSQPDDAPHLQWQWQDWGTPWTDYPLNDGGLQAVRAFAQQFYFGE